jgi:hypothetical protein
MLDAAGVDLEAFVAIASQFSALSFQYRKLIADG